MAQEDEKQKAEGDQPPAETILETTEQRDPEEATFAEQAIHHYAQQVLDQFRDSVENGLSAFTAWAESQNDKDAINNEGFNKEIGDVFLQQMMSACGGRDTPIGAAMFEQLDSFIDMSARQEHETSYFVNELSRGARDFTWYLRDNLQGVLSNEWDQLRDLAYEGSQDFIPAIHAFGLPKLDWAASDMTSTMVAIGEKVAQNKPKTPEEAVEKDPKQEEEQQKNALVEEEEKKQASV
jgi:hypothetical protein